MPGPMRIGCAQLLGVQQESLHRESLKTPPPSALHLDLPHAAVIESYTGQRISDMMKMSRLPS